MIGDDREQPRDMILRFRASGLSHLTAMSGDVAAGYFIVDRVGTQLELIPNLVDGSGSSRPTGERGAIMWARTGAEVVVPQALRLLDIPTTA